MILSEDYPELMTDLINYNGVYRAAYDFTGIAIFGCSRGYGCGCGFGLNTIIYFF